MNNYQDMIARVTETICENVDNEKNYILVGDNSSGKSEVLKMVIEKCLDYPIYFIDSVNRTFDTNKVELVSKMYKNAKMDSECVVRERIDAFNFNLQDVFNAAACIEQLYTKYSDKSMCMCKAFLNKDIQIVRENIGAGIAENRVLIDGNEAKLSSGYQAVIRIFYEILFFCDVMNEKKWEKGFVVIDEVDEYLSPRYSATILNYLQKEFPKLNFLVTTHSLDLVESTRNIDLIILKESEYEIYTEEQLESMVSADDIFVNLFFEKKIIHQSDNDVCDEQLRRLLNLKIAGMWDEKAEMELHEIEYERILPHQKLIYKQIEEW